MDHRLIMPKKTSLRASTEQLGVVAWVGCTLNAAAKHSNVASQRLAEGASSAGEQLPSTEEPSCSSLQDGRAADLLVARQLEAVAPGGDGAVSVPQQAPPAQPAVKGRQVVPHTVVAVLHIHNNDLQAD